MFMLVFKKLMIKTNSSASPMKHLEFTRYSLSQTLMSNALKYKASKGFRYICHICRWLGGGGGRMCHNFWEIWRRVRANLLLLRGGVLCKNSPCEAHF